MKKIVFLLIVSVYIRGSAQIKTLKPLQVTNIEEVEVSVYDSLTNYLKEDYKKYIGQKLYVLPKKEIFHKAGYDNFYSKISIDFKDKYKLMENGYNSDYSELVGKYFEVKDVVKSKYFILYLVLEEVVSKDILYFKYNKEYEGEFPFLTVGYFDKLNEVYKGKYININSWFHYIATPTDSKKSNYIKSELWEILDIVLNNSDNYELSVLIKNSKDEKLIGSFNLLKDTYESNVASKLIKKYGSNIYYNNILQKKVSIGFNSDLVKLIRGEPYQIYETEYENSTEEQWIYGKDLEYRSYYYFTNGKLTAIQN